jgi:hypothetical protein
MVSPALSWQLQHMGSEHCICIDTKTSDELAMKCLVDAELQVTEVLSAAC